MNYDSHIEIFDTVDVIETNKKASGIVEWSSFHCFFGLPIVSHVNQNKVHQVTSDVDGCA